MYIGFFFSNQTIANWFARQNLVLKYFSEIYVHHRAKYLPPIDCKDYSKPRGRLDVSDLYCISVLWSLGVLLGLILLLLERIFQHFHSQSFTFVPNKSSLYRI